MARKPKNNADYRPAPAKHGKKMEYMEKKYKNDGYAVWNKILDQLCDAEHHYLDLSCQMDLMLLASHCIISEELLVEIIEDLVSLKRFNKCLWDKKTVVFDQKLIDSLGELYEKRKNKCITLEGLCDLLNNKCTRKQGLCPLNGVGNTQSKVNKTKLEESKPNKSKDITTLSQASLTLSFLLFEGIKANNEKSKLHNFFISEREKQVNKWAVDIDRMIRIDKRTEQDIEAVIKFATEDMEFWHSNIQSGGKLRKQFDKLYITMNRPKKESEFI